METHINMNWHPRLSDPSGRRESKPRTKGFTMVIDKGLGRNEFRDLLDLSSPYIDIIKLGFGTSVLYPEDMLREKVESAKGSGLWVMPGGTFFEIAVTKGKFEHYLEMMCAMGFNAVEISDGTIELEQAERGRYIREARHAGFTVFTEYGKKSWGSVLETQRLVDTIHFDMENGAKLVTVEGRESGKGVGIYDTEGKCVTETVDEVLGQLADPNILLWETPHKDQQIELIRQIGPDANLGNIAPYDVLSLESLRRGLRSDTLYL